MPLNPLAPVTEYQSMLNRIFWFTSASALAAVWLLRVNVPQVDSLLSQLDAAVAMAGDALRATRGGYLLPALGMGIAFRVFRVHARISDWLGIREAFDVEVIVRELAARTGVDVDSIAKEYLRAARHEVMRKAFYPFVSTSKPQIDPQLIGQALEAWSWFWIGLEATLVFTLAGLGLIAGGAYMAGGQTLWFALAFSVFGLPALRNQCARYAVAQVREIVADPVRAAIVHSAFDELGGGSRRIADAA